MKHAAAMLLLLVCASPLQAQEAEHATRQELLAERQKLIDDIKRLSKEVEALETTYDEKLLFTGLPPAREKTIRLEQLKRLRLPLDPDRAKVRSYVGAIVQLSRNQQSFAIYDPQIMMLQRIGPENADMLLQYVNIVPEYIIPALRVIADERHKEAILQSLPAQRKLVDVVIEKGWTKNAREILLTEMRERPENLPSAWVYAVAHLHDPSTYDALKRYMVQADNPVDVYNTIKVLEKINLTDAVAETWKHAKQTAWRKWLFAPIAIEYGHADALAYAVKALKEAKGLSPVPYSRAVLTRHLGYDGPYKQLPEWFQQHKDALVFDPETKRYGRVKTDNPAHAADPPSHEAAADR